MEEIDWKFKDQSIDCLNQFIEYKNTSLNFKKLQTKINNIKTIGMYVDKKKLFDGKDKWFQHIQFQNKQIGVFCTTGVKILPDYVRKEIKNTLKNKVMLVITFNKSKTHLPKINLSYKIGLIDIELKEFIGEYNTIDGDRLEQYDKQYDDGFILMTCVTDLLRKENNE